MLNNKVEMILLLATKLTLTCQVCANCPWKYSRDTTSHKSYS